MRVQFVISGHFAEMRWRGAIRMFNHYARDKFVARQSGIGDRRIDGVPQDQPDFHPAIIHSCCHIGHHPSANNANTVANIALPPNQIQYNHFVNRVDACDIATYNDINANTVDNMHNNEYKNVMVPPPFA